MKFIAPLFAIVALLLLSSTALANGNGQEKVTLCHAAGQAGTTQYVTIEVGWPAAYGPAGHFYANGTPRAGHEQDYLGACKEPSPTPKPTPTATPVVPTATPVVPTATPVVPTPVPTAPPVTPVPTAPPVTPVPTAPPVTPVPTVVPSVEPSVVPSDVPTDEPTASPETVLPETDTVSGTGGGGYGLILLILAAVAGTAMLVRAPKR